MSSDEAQKNAPKPSTGDKIDEVYWPLLREILRDDPSAMDRLNLKCPICLEVMPLDSEETDLLHNHTARILFCGHIFGLSCLVKHVKARKELGLKYSCPLGCDFVTHSTCKCPNMGDCVPEMVEYLDAPCVRTINSPPPADNEPTDSEPTNNDPSVAVDKGPKLPSVCRSCSMNSMTHGLMSLAIGLAVVHEPELVDKLKSFEISFAISNGVFHRRTIGVDEREGAEMKIPVFMQESCLAVEAAMASMYPYLKKPHKVYLWKYETPIQRDWRFEFLRCPLPHLD